MVLSKRTDRTKAPAEDHLSTADTLLRIVFSILIIVFFVMSVRLFLLNREFAAPGYTLPGEQTLETPAPSHRDLRSERALAALPIPMMPGAKRPTGVKMSFNGGDFVRVEFDTRARIQDVLSFYRNWLRRQGWQDWVEESYRPRHAGSFSELPGLPGGMQNESLLRFYDQMQRTQLNFAKGDKRVSVFSKGSENARKGNRIALQYMENGSPEAITRTGSRKRFKPFMQFSEQLGKERMQTSFIQDRKRPRDFHRALIARFHRQGWQVADVPMPIGRPMPKNYTQLARSGETMYLQVSPSSDKGGSVATITTVSSLAR